MALEMVQCFLCSIDMKQQSKLAFIHRELRMAGVKENCKGAENLCMLRAMYNAMDKKQQDIVTVNLVETGCRRINY